jgi:hypothetical protein
MGHAEIAAVSAAQNDVTAISEKKKTPLRMGIAECFGSD